MQHTLRRCLVNMPFLRHNPNLHASIKYAGASTTSRQLSTLPQENRKEHEEQQQPSRNRLPRLMQFPEVIWPSVFNTVKNWITVKFIIRPYLDSEFQVKDFVFGAKKALQVVSSKMVGGDLNALQNLVTTEAITELKPVIQKLSMTQRRQLEINESDIYLSFPYQIGIMFDEANDKIQKRWVEITMVFHVMRGLSEMRERGEEIPWNMGTMPEYQDKVFICNYRFIKEFTTGQQSDWTINVVNHFKAIDLINEK
ncbi:m-AAA protease-interacting protein 1, mitochondrial [Scaptodrosophila lebanonensis]|uniref:M-AAA protease-interacting protein 1, mitochondrial n=1 Tax=Drosophila lebanonensis TaxID=7225 RepID=A0A6J2UK39_DROLE|nr:m-AAA protease-interacting protein 1, mitochondrial [Scaptodrosophila lebanonensis]